MGQTAQTEHERLEEATGWMLRLDAVEPGTPAYAPLFAQFDLWIAHSAENRAAWEDVNRTWRVLGAGQPAAAASPAATVALPRRAAGPATVRRAPARRGPRIAATLGVLAAALLVWLAAPMVLLALQADHRTHAGQMEQITLNDGSTVELGGDSAIATRLSDGQRQVRLLAGQAFFDVTRDAARPFIVDVAGVEVKVLGTAFDVQVTSTTTTVALLHGAVEAMITSGGQPPTRLKPGQMLNLDRATGVVVVADVPPEDIGAWREGKVFIAEATIGEAVEMMQRYHRAWISLPDRTLAAQRVSGLFDLRDVDQALVALVEPFGGKVRQVTPLTRVISRW
ncbi:FecR family protein [Xanthobacteraceae bacterium A53D]